MITHAFFDLDGVLADFASKAMVAHDKRYDFAQWPPGEWEFYKVLGLENEAAFWRAIDAMDPMFWPELDPYPWKDEMVEMACQIFPAVSFLTSPSRHKSSYSGKREWAQRHLPYNANLILCKTKELLAREDRLLIDDSDKNVKAWEDAGGKAILLVLIYLAHQDLRLFRNNCQIFRQGS